MEDTSSDEELSDVERNVDQLVEGLTRSQDKTDKRFVNIYRLRMAQENG